MGPVLKGLFPIANTFIPKLKHILIYQTKILNKFPKTTHTYFFFFSNSSTKNAIPATTFDIKN